MEMIKIIFMIAVTMALSITLMTSIGSRHAEQPQHFGDDASKEDSLIPSSRVSRFLAEDYKNPRAADHCNKDYDVCYVHGTNATTCCNNKCIDVHYDNKNCGVCKHKCKYTEVCCRGECVNTNYDKRHCGGCNQRCKTGDYCIYGMCDYSI